MKTNADYTVAFMDYGLLTVPKGTKVTHQTACGIDETIHFVDEFGWAKNQYPEIYNILLHDLIHRGINVPKEYISY